MESILPGLSAAPNLHPMVVHFPIALWLAALLFWSLAVVRKQDDLWRTGRWLLYLGTLGGLVAVGTGFWATEAMGHDSPGHGLVHVHRNFMITTTSLALITAVFAHVTRSSTSARLRFGLVALLGVTAGVLTLGADRGAELVFRYGIGTAGETPPAADGHDHDHDHGDHAPATPETPVS
jgi:uncharacterized membrane protein